MFFFFFKLCSFFSPCLSVVPHQTKLGGDRGGNEKLKGKQMREGVKEFNCAFLIFFGAASRQILYHVNMVRMQSAM